MADRKIGVVIDGATGRLGTTQHLRALLDDPPRGRAAARKTATG